MRKMIFRGQSLNDGKWMYGYIRHYENNKHTTEKWTIYEPTLSLEHEVDPDTIGEYTGKLVNNDKLFDGDICAFTYIPNPYYNNPNEYAVTVVVEWSERNFGWCLHNICPRSKKHPSRKQYFTLGDYRIFNLKIIGNRWENNNLLKGGDE